jgi:hypothetical protein
MSRDVVWLNKSYEAWIKSKNDTSVSDDDSDNEVEVLKDKREIEIPPNDFPLDGKDERITIALNHNFNLKRGFNPYSTRLIKSFDLGRESVPEKADSP